MKNTILFNGKEFEGIIEVLKEYLHNDNDDCIATYKGRPVVLDFGDMESDKSLYGFVYDQIEMIGKEVMKKC